MPDEGFKKSSIKQLSAKGKETFWNAIEEYVDAKIDARTSSLMTKGLRDVVENRVEKATEELKNKIMALSIQLE